MFQVHLAEYTEAGRYQSQPLTILTAATCDRFMGDSYLFTQQGVSKMVSQCISCFLPGAYQFQQTNRNERSLGYESVIRVPKDSLYWMSQSHWLGYNGWISSHRCWRKMRRTSPVNTDVPQCMQLG